MVNQNTTQKLQRPVGTFQTQEEIQVAQNALEAKGFSQDHISIVVQDSDPNPTMQRSQVFRSAVGGAIAGSVFGSLIGAFFSLFSHYLNSTDGATPDVSTSFVTGICTLVGLVGGGLIAALAGNSVPHVGPASDRASLTRIYVLMLNGTADEAYQAKEALGQPEIQI
ncbi:MAG: general stress protein [Oculatellaceae cyanobacterium bins.114]|nr:general stress protein [Oculatellaceae cyanobacterium bins.114]